MYRVIISVSTIGLIVASLLSVEPVDAKKQQTTRRREKKEYQIIPGVPNTPWCKIGQKSTTRKPCRRAGVGTGK